jgi:fimbrial chaperone protein
MKANWILQLTIKTEYLVLFRVLLGVLVVFAATMFVGLPARADVMISPIYVIFEGRQRSAEVTLVNVTNTTNVYRLEWSLTRQKEDGSYETLDQLPEGAIDPRTFVRFAPRQVTLMPQARQLVRLQLQKPEDLPDGEYRIHLNFKRLPNDQELRTRKNQTQGMSLELRVTVGVSMPVVIRHGDYKPNVQIADARFIHRKKGNTNEYRDPELMVRVERAGLYGTYGRLRVFWENDGKDTQIGTLNNFSVYADNPARVGFVPLTVDQVTTGRLRIVYEGDGPQRGKVLTEQYINIGG